ncbi:Membrane protein involved in the export of O-antigen and teichoic acid [Parasphingorhabdus marina DSM 22363]|uniref:Membrane protein involved in the export of O-antigen and teichoic acid n=1 Tax=Parasphingorhabdus marina DSM 22363 TaxID=1123272 RepID=A0A1N6HPS6_9SPHN|nr:hypothetical protein [Parasphingorhabdus marina]SIO21868.1 Membrane protein involved in the export of O-antigen and teichoic acid [Parasphingorhabdus marina DSM 22363]
MPKHMGIANSTALMSGSGAVGQALQLVGIILLTQVYAVESFGELTLAINTAALCAIAFGLQLHLAIPTVRDERTVNDIAHAIVCNALILGAISTAVLLLLDGILATGALIGILVCLSNSSRAMLVRLNRIHLVALANLGRAVCIVGGQAVMVNLELNGLVAGLIFGEACICLFLFLKSRQRLRLFSHVKQGLQKATIAKFSDFSFWGTIQEFVSVAVVFMPFFLCARLFSEAELGNFGMAHRLIWGPVVVVSVGFGWAFLGAVGQKPSQFFEVLKQIRYYHLLLLAIVGVSLSWIVLQPIMLFILSTEWMLAARISPIMFSAAIVFLASSPFRQMIRICKKQKWQLGIDFMTIIFIALTLLFPYRSAFDWITMIGAVLIVQNLATILCGWIAANNYREPENV